MVVAVVIVLVVKAIVLGGTQKSRIHEIEIEVCDAEQARQWEQSHPVNNPRPLFRDRMDDGGVVGPLRSGRESACIVEILGDCSSMCVPMP